MVTVGFYDAQGQTLGQLSVAAGQPVRTSGDLSWLDFRFEPHSERLGRPVSWQEDCEEWARSLARAYADTPQLSARVEADSNRPAADGPLAPVAPAAPIAATASGSAVAMAPITPTVTGEADRNGEQAPKGRFAFGWYMSKKCWRVLRANKSLTALPVISAAFSMLAALIIFAPALGLYLSSDSEVPLYAAGALALFVANFCSVFFGVALVACAERAFAGQQVSIGDGVAAARQRLGAIALWSAILTVLGLVLSWLEQQGTIGNIVRALLGASWAVLSFFAVPILAYEHVGPFGVLKRSTQIMRQQWGSAVVGVLGAGLIAFVYIGLPALAVIAVGALLVAGGALAGGVLIIALGALVMVAAIVVSGTLNALLRMALYRYAVAGAPLAGFAPAEMDRLVRHKKSLRRK